MSDPKQMPADGAQRNKGGPDGISASPGSDPEAGVHGRTSGGESGGGGYANPHTGKASDNSGFLGHGGQTEIDYHGGGQAKQGGDAPNAATGSRSSDGVEREAPPAPDAERKARKIEANGQSFEVIETSGVAEAEATGKVATDEAYEAEQNNPGSG